MLNWFKDHTVFCHKNTLHFSTSSLSPAGMDWWSHAVRGFFSALPSTFLNINRSNQATLFFPLLVFVFRWSNVLMIFLQNNWCFCKREIIWGNLFHSIWHLAMSQQENTCVTNKTNNHGGNLFRCSSYRTLLLCLLGHCHGLLGHLNGMRTSSTLLEAPVLFLL